jgi:hypothetical protein
MAIDDIYCLHGCGLSGQDYPGDKALYLKLLQPAIFTKQA